MEKFVIGGELGLNFVYGHVYFSYVNHQEDRWYSDSDIEVEIDKTTAEGIIKFLQSKFNI